MNKMDFHKLVKSQEINQIGYMQTYARKTK